MWARETAPRLRAFFWSDGLAEGTGESPNTYTVAHELQFQGMTTYSELHGYCMHTVHMQTSKYLYK